MDGQGESSCGDGDSSACTAQDIHANSSVNSTGSFPEDTDSGPFLSQILETLPETLPGPVTNQEDGAIGSDSLDNFSSSHQGNVCHYLRLLTAFILTLLSL
jgi:hypothetical protein